MHEGSGCCACAVEIFIPTLRGRGARDKIPTRDNKHKDDTNIEHKKRKEEHKDVSSTKQDQVVCEEMMILMV